MARPQLKDLSLREKIGQTVCVRENLMTKIPNLVEHLKRYPYGCMWAMGNQLNDTENVADAIDKNGKATGAAYREIAKGLMAVTKVPILMAGNTESGFSGVFSELTPTLCQMAYAATDDEHLTYEASAAVAREMRSSGVQWKWSPNIDIACREASYNVGRTFSDNIETVIRFASACVRGAQDNGVAVSIKHFPGQDEWEYRDPHFSSAINRQSRKRWNETNGHIYSEIIKRSNPWAIMVGHNSIPCIDSGRLHDGSYPPATLSYKLLTEVLKGEMHYQGVVITDAIGMKSLHELYPENELYIQLLLAGNDIILGPTSKQTDNYIDVVEHAVLDGRIPESRIDDACERVLQMKENIGMFSENYGLSLDITPALMEKTKNIEKIVAEKAVTLVRNEDDALPICPEKVRRILIVPDAYWEDFNEYIHYTGDLLKDRGFEVEYLWPGDLNFESQSLQETEKYDLVLIAAYLRAHRPAGCSGFNDKYQNILGYLQFACNEKIVSVSYGSPFLYFDHFTNIGKAFVNAYDYTEEMQSAVVKALVGEISFSGKSPFRLYPDYALKDIIE